MKITAPRHRVAPIAPTGPRFHSVRALTGAARECQATLAFLPGAGEAKIVSLYLQLRFRYLSVSCSRANQVTV
ncbi:MAG: hypothetical protein ABSF26_27910 [Thermoguttaceae bacterium]